MNANFGSQEVMTTLSTDTGGTAFLDSNDFAPAFAKVQSDTSAYYAIGFHSSNPARDGKYRRLTVKVNRPGIKLEFRPGYYAPADFRHRPRTWRFISTRCISAWTRAAFMCRFRWWCRGRRFRL
jgi:hypothetical protein